MPSDLSNYLATHYLIADPKPSRKKRKRKNDDAGGLLITDESELGWTPKADDDEHDDQLAAATVAGTSAEFRKAKKSAWKTVGGAATTTAGKKTTARPTTDDAVADAVLASAAAESAAAVADDDAAPVVMGDGTHAGLQSASAVTAQLEKRARKERAEFEWMRKHEKEAETVYRDATGKRIDVSMKRAEARRLAAEAAEKEAQAKEALKGEVQIEEAKRRRAELDDAKLMHVARGIDDEDMNRELKETARWGDTMAEFVQANHSLGGPRGGEAADKGKKVKGRPVYQGAAAPNRYGIRPGYRWDGVDRGNGFEAERFKAINRVERNRALEYNWQMDE